jgi:hypothetical protein
MGLFAVDQLLLFLLEDNRNVAARMAAAGYSEDEIRGAWHYAREAGFTESSGLGQDRITEVGRARAATLKSDRPQHQTADMSELG